MKELEVAIAWLRVRIDTARRDETGATAVEWLLIILATIAIAGIAVAAVRAYVVGQTNKLGSP